MTNQYFKFRVDFKVKSTGEKKSKNVFAKNRDDAFTRVIVQSIEDRVLSNITQLLDDMESEQDDQRLDDKGRTFRYRKQILIEYFIETEEEFIEYNTLTDDEVDELFKKYIDDGSGTGHL